MKNFAFALLLAANSAFAENDHPSLEWSEYCQLEGTQIVLSFVSESGKATQSDQKVSLKFGSGERIPLAIEPRLFIPAQFTTDVPNHCSHIGAFDWRDNNVLLLLPYRSKPTESRITALILNLQTGKIAQDFGDLGAYADGEAVEFLRDRRGYRLSLFRSWSPDADASGELGVMDWMTISPSNGTGALKWQTVQP